MATIIYGKRVQDFDVLRYLAATFMLFGTWYQSRNIKERILDLLEEERRLEEETKQKMKDEPTAAGVVIHKQLQPPMEQREDAKEGKEKEQTKKGIFNRWD